jgi:hypothetical protein
MSPNGSDDVEIAEADDCRRQYKNVCRHRREIRFALPPRRVTRTLAFVYVADGFLQGGSAKCHRCIGIVFVGQSTCPIDSDCCLSKYKNLNTTDRTTYPVGVITLTAANKHLCTQIDFHPTANTLHACSPSLIPGRHLPTRIHRVKWILSRQGKCRPPTVRAPFLALGTCSHKRPFRLDTHDNSDLSGRDTSITTSIDHENDAAALFLLLPQLRRCRCFCSRCCA